MLRTTIRENNMISKRKVWREIKKILRRNTGNYWAMSPQELEEKRKEINRLLK